MTRRRWECTSACRTACCGQLDGRGRSGGRALQIFTDNPMAWRRRPEAPLEAPDFIDYEAREGLRTVAVHASYLIGSSAGSAEPFASQSRAGLIVELQRAPSYGATIVNTHIGSHRGVGAAAGLTQGSSRERPCRSGVIARQHGLALENSSGGGEVLVRFVRRAAGARPGRRPRTRSPRLLPGHGAPDVGAPATTSPTPMARRR